MSCGIGCRRGLDLELLWLWCRSAATAPIGPLAWEPPYAMSAVLKKTKKKKKAKAWNHPKCPLIDDWIRKMWYIYTTEYYSAIKKTQNNE